MARETKTIQCYPDDDIINRKVSRYEAFGWELIGNQRCQEFTGQTETSDTITNHYSTFNKLTFSRDKSAPWYDKVVRLESEFENLMDREPSRPADKRFKPFSWFGIIMFLIVGLVPLCVYRIALFQIIGGVVTGIASILLIVAIVKSVNYNKRYSAYLREKIDWEKTDGVTAEEIMDKAEALVNGKAE